MSSFKVYLPSNACPDIYPNNTPTDYHINFDNPIELEGQWEVGVESICYASKIYDSAETASIDVTVGNIIRPYTMMCVPFAIALAKKINGLDLMV